MRIAISGEQVLEVQRRQTFQLDCAKGARIDCQRGVLWITQNGDPRDVVLSAWQSFTVDRPGTALIHAFEASTVRLTNPESSRSPPRNAAKAAFLRVIQHVTSLLDKNRFQPLRGVDLAAMSWHEQRDILGYRIRRELRC